MQVLKDEIRNKILIVAENSFYTKGFKDTTTRQIAEEVGIRVSNLYLYFENKEAILHGVVDGFHRYFLDGLKVFFDHNDRNNNIDVGISKILQEIICADHKKFVILTDKCQGTKYENFKQHIILHLFEHMKSQVNRAFISDDLILYILAKNFTDGIVEIAKNYQDGRRLQYNIESLVNYHIKGMEHLL